ncbi:hypothetical protein LCGC14_0932560 [marine sediment metagenome]|uniref:Uncharacterized protein n=1 Tax=marine sediment metagenome TaxID=412755 RepID=A0A0F9R609_9ZZZZ
MHLVKTLSRRKRGATEPPFVGQITELDGSPTDLSVGITDIRFRLGTPGLPLIIDKAVTLTAPVTGEWEYRPTSVEADALTPGEHLLHLIINWSDATVEPVPFDFYFKLEVLPSL